MFADFCFVFELNCSVKKKKINIINALHRCMFACTELKKAALVCTLNSHRFESHLNKNLYNRKIEMVQPKWGKKAE